MSPREGFGIVVRTVGLGLILHGLARAMEAMMVHGWGVGAWIHLMLIIVVGVGKLAGGKPLVAWAYKTES
jgi:hypothetical protein